jgi:hypothetical protein
MPSDRTYRIIKWAAGGYILGWLLGAIFRNPILRTIFVILLIIFSYKTFIFFKLWDSFAPEYITEENIPVDLQYTSMSYYVRNNTSDKWLVQVDVNCQYYWKNGNPAFTRTYTHGLGTVWMAWLSPGNAMYIPTVTANLPVQLNDNLSNNFVCKPELAKFRTVLDTSAYQMQYRVDSHDIVHAKVYNFNTDKNIDAIDIACYVDNNTSQIRLFPSDGPYTSPGQWGEFASKQTIPFNKPNINCVAVRIQLYE